MTQPRVKALHLFRVRALLRGENVGRAGRAVKRVCDVARRADNAVFERRQGIFVLDFREHAQPLCAERDGVAVFIQKIEPEGLQHALSLIHI